MVLTANLLIEILRTISNERKLDNQKLMRKNRVRENFNRIKQGVTSS